MMTNFHVNDDSLEINFIFQILHSSIMDFVCIRNKCFKRMIKKENI